MTKPKEVKKTACRPTRNTNSSPSSRSSNKSAIPRLKQMKIKLTPKEVLDVITRRVFNSLECSQFPRTSTPRFLKRVSMRRLETR